MIGIILVSHGPMARAMIKTAEMILGKQENLHGVSLNADTNLDLLRGRVETAAQAAEAGQGVLVLVDMFGGTPANAVASNLRGNNYRCLCGVNLPMLLEACLLRESMLLAELATHVEDVACRSVVNLNTALERTLRGDMPRIGGR